MSREFKAGDKVVCVDNGSGYRDRLTVGKEYDLLEGSFSDYVSVTSDDGGIADAYASRFELVKPHNGVDAMLQPLNFTESMLKPMMRVVTKSEGEWICVEASDRGLTLCQMGKEGFNTSLFLDSDVSDIEKCYSAQEIYEVAYASQSLAPFPTSKLVWKRTPPKTAEQLAQEAATAAREAMIEEAEKALKSAQEKLAALKNI